MDYRNLQQKLKPFKLAGLANIRLNEKKTVLEKEYQRCLELGLSKTSLEKRLSYQQKVNQTLKRQSSLGYLKSRVYTITKLNNIQEVRRNYYQIREKKFDFRRKLAWQECLKILEDIHKDTLLFEQFTTKITSVIKRYRAFAKEMGEDSSLSIQELFELKDVVKEYVPDTLSLTPQQKLMQSWLQQALANNNIKLV